MLYIPKPRPQDEFEVAHLDQPVVAKTQPRDDSGIGEDDVTSSESEFHPPSRGDGYLHL